MIMSALISQCRRASNDIPKSSQAVRAADGVSTLFNLGRYPILENSYAVYFATSGKAETTDYTLDKDSGDLATVAIQPNNRLITVNFKYANWRDIAWLEAINQGISELNARGYFKQVIRGTSPFNISANVTLYSGPTNCIDLYELLVSDNFTISGNYVKLSQNWSYQQDNNKVILGAKPFQNNYTKISYLRNLQAYSATSATLDVLDDWIPLLKIKAQQLYANFFNMKIAGQGTATVDEGHLSNTAWRLLSNDKAQEFELLSKRKKPTRPAKDIQFRIDGGGVA